MGIYIKGMKMPKDDETIRFVKLLNGKMVAVTSPTKEVGDIHEVIEVTEPHGRLIDADALCRYALNQTNESVSPNEIMRFPCVIEAEGE